MAGGVRIGSEGASPGNDLSAIAMPAQDAPDPQVLAHQMALFHATRSRFAPTGPESEPQDITAFSQAPARAMAPPMPQMPKPQTPVVQGDARAVVPRGQKTQLALYFAKAMGHQVPGEVDSPDELAFAKAAHQALLKMTKGMTVARFLQSHQSPKTRDTFSRLLDAELTKARQPQPTSGKTPTNNTPVPFAARATQGEEIPQ